MSHNDDLDKNIIAGHEYDGIKELDNPLPKWWQVTFYLTIIFSIIYYGYYELGSGPSTQLELEQDLAKISQDQQKAEASAPKAEDVDFKALIANAEAMQRAQGHFASKCAACHGQKGEGLIGPNLTDNYWIHDKGSFVGVVKIIEKGVLDKGMPPWKGVIPDAEVKELSAYVLSLKGTNPPNAKAPQGDLVEE